MTTHGPIAQSAWDEGIQAAADAGIGHWMVKTFAAPGESSEAGSAVVNAWSMSLAPGVQGAGFVHWKYHVPAACDQRRFVSAEYLTSATLLPGSECTGWHADDAGGRKMWGEHTWCARPGSTGWFSFAKCSSPHTMHILVVNRGYDYPPRYQTLIGKLGHNTGAHDEYDEDGGAFEFFYKPML